jgi:Holliday junction DNA helicase RuvA
MIAKLKGIVDMLSDDNAIIDVNGVGYLVSCSGRTLSRMPNLGEAVSMMIETHVREDQISLFGFLDIHEKEWFKLLQSVQGVGAKVALGILSTLSTEELAQAISLQDRTMVGRAKGVGPKMATRLVTELKDKAPAPAIAATFSTAKSNDGSAPATHLIAARDAISALGNLGYRHSEASAVVERIMASEGEDASVQVLIRLGLKELSA